MAHRAPLLLLSALLTLLLAACSAPAATPVPASTQPATTPPSASVAPSAYPVTVTDDAGTELTLDAPPERIVSLAPSSTEIVCALEACDRLVGVTDFDDYPAEVADIDDVVINAQVDVERVVAAEPDLVIAAGNEITPSAVIAQLVELDLQVLVLYPETLDEVYDDIRLVGTLLDAQGGADELIAGMEDRVDAVVEAVADADRPRTLYEVFYAEGSTYTAGEGSFLASLIGLAGGEPVTGDAQGLIGAEDLVAADPQLILLGTASYDPTLADADAARTAVAARPGWADLSAVADGRVVPYTDDIVTTRPGPRIVDGLEALARAIHPDRFD
ncbi:MAG TPA: ABC transporter substrate-binding protein [Candidatus Limnocylindria bacterium]|nr:ABC transporter substrate-binding protein [Candidatus Limnocylindria bacterium]